MNEYQIKLYSDLMNLASSNNEAFFYKDQFLDDVTYRVFSYRLASYTDFCLPNATESRGIMFELGEEGNPIRLASMPMNKFWNVNENLFTMNLDFKNPKQIMLKMDGSLISTYIHKDDLMLKSKTSLSSEHARNAMKYLSKKRDLQDTLLELTTLEYTVNMEYTSPEPNMRIVIGYQEPKLTILNIRDNRTGEYVSIEDLESEYGNYFSCELSQYWVDTVNLLPGEGTQFV